MDELFQNPRLQEARAPWEDANLNDGRALRWSAAWEKKWKRRKLRMKLHGGEKSCKILLRLTRVLVISSRLKVKSLPSYG